MEVTVSRTANFPSTPRLILDPSYIFPHSASPSSNSGRRISAGVVGPKFSRSSPSLHREGYGSRLECLSRSFVCSAVYGSSRKSKLNSAWKDGSRHEADRGSGTAEQALQFKSLVSAKINPRTEQFFSSESDGDVDRPTEGFSSITEALEAIRQGKGAGEHKKSFSESRAMLPKVDSEGATRDGGLGNFSTVYMTQVSTSVQAALLSPVNRFKRCMEAQLGLEFTSSSPDSMHQAADLITTEHSWMRANGKPDLLQEKSSVDGPLSWVSTGNKISSNVSTQIFQHLQAGQFGNWAPLKQLALITSVLGLQACSQAWAGPEVAQINLNSSFDLWDASDIQSGFASAFLLILFSEIGDKTFFIAAILASRKSSLVIFSGTFGALSIMTVISVFLGRIFHYIDGILPSFGDTKLPVDDIAAVLLLVYFGVSTLLDASAMEGSESGEEQQKAELAIAGVGTGGAVAGTVAATFALVFVAEWGDKSFFSTIALAAASSPLGVVTGAIAGHGAATLLAVLGGSFLGKYISEKVIAYIGGVLFLVFAGVTLVDILN